MRLNPNMYHRIFICGLILYLATNRMGKKLKKLTTVSIFTFKNTHEISGFCINCLMKILFGTSFHFNCLMNISANLYVFNIV